MTILSLAYYVSLIASLAVYYMLPAKAQWPLLLVLSLAFLTVNGSLPMLALFMGIVAIAWAGGMWIARANASRKRLYCVIAVLGIAGILFYCKDMQFIHVIRSAFGKLFSVSVAKGHFQVVSLLGMSYFSLSLIGYVLDVYWGTCPVERNYLKLLLFAGYFPQVIAGPITRYEGMKPQFFSPHTFSGTKILLGAQRVLWGCFKKLVLSDRAAIFVNSVFHAPGGSSGFILFIGVLMYVFLFYTDFSGCMDIIIGVSECFQIRLPENFNTPFASRSLAEFWRRWHMTMGAWFRDYLLYPLMKSAWFRKTNQWLRKRLGRQYGKKVATCLGLSAVWMAIGLWHGGRAVFILVSGLIPGFFLMMSELLEDPVDALKSQLHLDTDGFGWRLFGQARVLLAMCFSWIFMCAGSVKAGWTAVASLFDAFDPSIVYDGTLLNHGISLLDWGILLVGLILLVLVGAWHERGVRIREALHKRNIVFRGLVLLAALISIVVFGVYGPDCAPKSFIYQQF